MLTPTMLKALSSLNVGIIELDRDYRITVINEAACRLTHRLENDVIGRTCWEIWRVIDSTHVGMAIRKAMEQRTSESISSLKFKQYGKAYYCDFHCFPTDSGLMALFVDVADREVAKASRAEAEKRLALATQATTDALWEWDVPGDTIRWSPEDATFIGTDTVTERAMEFWLERMHPDDRQRTYDQLMRMINDGLNQWNLRFRMIIGHGHFALLEARGFLLRDEHGKALRAVGAVTDLTDVEAIQQRVDQLQSQLLHVSRVSAMGVMASTMGHELNQPLSAVTTYLTGVMEFLNSKSPDREHFIRQGVEQAIEAAMRAGQIISRVRAMTKHREFDTQEVEVSEAVKDAKALALLGLYPSVSDVRVEVPANVRVQADLIQLQQVLMNLIRNGLEAMQPQGGGIVTVRARTQAGAVLIEVSDEGPGIPPDMRDRLFEPFVTGKPTGLGLGLPICRTIIEAHGGRIRADTNDKGGATFCVSLPAMLE